VRLLAGPDKYSPRYIVGLKSGTLELGRGAARQDARHPACKRALAYGDPHDDFLALGDECITAHHGFEGSGEIDAWRGDVRSYLGGETSWLVLREHDVLAVDGFCYVLGCKWGLDSLTRAGDGQWERRSLIEGAWSEALVGFKADGDSVDVLIRLPMAPPAEVPCADRTVVEGVSGRTAGGFVLLRVEADGRAYERD
jgi:hypothetical protein